MTFNCDQLRVVEQFYSIQGESSFAGLPCHFIRLHGCNLRCSYCDTVYANNDAQYQVVQISDLVKQYAKNETRLIEFTGGEPLLQIDPVIEACRELVKYCTVLIETNGSVDISPFRWAPPELVLVMDVKTPSSQMHEKLLQDNFKHLRTVDEVKFVIGDYTDFQFAKQIIEKYNLHLKCKMLASPIFGITDVQELARWVLNETPYMRLQLQMHKIIWNPSKRGV